MPNIRELSFDEIVLVSGGEGHGTEVMRDRQDAINSGAGRGAPATTANNAGVGAILGTVGAVIAGATPVGIAAAAVIGGLSAAMPSTSGSSSNADHSGGWHDTNPGGMVGECRW